MRIFSLAFIGAVLVFGADDATAKWSKSKCSAYKQDINAIQKWLNSFNPNTSSQHRAAYNKGFKTLNNAKRDYTRNC